MFLVTMKTLEARLNLAVKNGDVESIKECCSEAFRLYSRLLFHAANEVLFDAESARDATSEAFVSFMSNLEGVKFVSVKYYLVQSVRRIAARMLLDASKKSDLDEGSEPSGDVMPKVELDAKKALSILNDEERRIVIFKIEYGYKFAEIAEMMGISEDAASSKFTRSIKKMREALDGRNER